MPADPYVSVPGDERASAAAGGASSSRMWRLASCVFSPLNSNPEGR